MEVIVTLQFTTPCLGNERHPDRDLMLRNVEGRVIFMPSWWKAVFKFAAQAAGRFHRDIDKIKVDPEISGNTSVYKRYYTSAAFKEHEAFDAGSQIEAHFWLPDQVKPQDLHNLLTVAGKYVGLSPYGHDQDFGRFSVISVTPGRKRPHTTGREPSTDHPVVQQPVRAIPSV